MSGIEAKIEAIESLFRHDSKQWKAARYIVRQNRKITSDERKAICQEIPIAYKSLQGLFTKLRKMDLYPPQKISNTSNRPQPIEKPQETSHQAPEYPQPPLQEYATKEEFETLKNSINYLASVMSGENPSNPGEDEEEEDIEVIPPEEMLIEDPSLTRKTVWLKPKTQMYFDMSRQGVFSNYEGTRDLGPFTNFEGNLSDFFNIIVDDYFIRNYNADIGLLMRRYA
uniref:Uncharacterized protein n=1 Tax=viral metagenome TaxID=1070528 RepID=A0A6M3MES0_9ZZZZ